jgi:hypothetical protein
MANGPTAWATGDGPIWQPARLSSSARLLRSPAPSSLSNYDAALVRVSSCASGTDEGEGPQAQVKIGGNVDPRASSYVVGITNQTMVNQYFFLLGPRLSLVIDALDQNSNPIEVVVLLQSGYNT